MRLASFNPASLLLGPVFQKEVRASGRRRGTYAFRCLYAAALLTLVCIAFQGLRTSADRQGGVARLQSLQTLAPTIALFVIWFQFVALALAAPMLAGPAISDERRARSLATLLTTPLTAGQIIGGKLASRIVQLAILSLLAAPLLLAIRVFGGLNASLILGAAAVSLATACLGATLGLTFSVWHRRATGAGLFGLLTLILIIAAPSVVEGLHYYALTQRGVPAKYHTEVLVTCSPVALGYLTTAAVQGIDPPHFTLSASWLPGGSLDLGPAWAVNSIYTLALCLPVSLFATRSLRRIMKREGAAEGAIGPAAEPESPPAEPPTDPAAAPVPPRPTQPRAKKAAVTARESRQVSDRPVLWRETRQVTLGSRRKFLIVLTLAVAGLLYLYARWGIFEAGMHMSLGLVGALAVAIQAVFMTTGSIAGEREARTWEVLLTTGLSGRDIILGKALGTLRAQWFLPTIVFTHFVIAVVFGAVSPILLLHLALIWLGPLLFFTATGQLFSLIFRRGVTAAAWNLAIALILYAGLWIVLGLLNWYAEFANRDLFNTIGKGVFAIDPIPMTLAAIEPAIHEGRFHRGTGNYDLASGGGPLNVFDFTLFVLAAFTGYALLTVGVISAAITRFTRLSGRSS